MEKKLEMAPEEVEKERKKDQSKEQKGQEKKLVEYFDKEVQRITKLKGKFSEKYSNNNIKSLSADSSQPIPDEMIVVPIDHIWISSKSGLKKKYDIVIHGFEKATAEIKIAEKEYLLGRFEKRARDIKKIYQEYHSVLNSDDTNKRLKMKEEHGIDLEDFEKKLDKAYLEAEKLKSKIDLNASNGKESSKGRDSQRKNHLETWQSLNSFLESHDGLLTTMNKIRGHRMGDVVSQWKKWKEKETKSTSDDSSKGSIDADRLSKLFKSAKSLHKYGEELSKTMEEIRNYSIESNAIGESLKELLSTEELPLPEGKTEELISNIKELRVSSTLVSVLSELKAIKDEVPWWSRRNENIDNAINKVEANLVWVDKHVINTNELTTPSMSSQYRLPVAD